MAAAVVFEGTSTWPLGLADVCVCVCRQLRDAREQRQRLESRIHNLQQQLAAAAMAAASSGLAAAAGGGRMATRQQFRDVLALERERVADQQVC